jgi:hypothetical protein
MGLVLFTLCLDQLVLQHVLGGLMEQTFNLDLLYAIHAIQEYYACLIRR